MCSAKNRICLEIHLISPVFSVRSVIIFFLYTYRKAESQAKDSAGRKNQFTYLLFLRTHYVDTILSIFAHVYLYIQVTRTDRKDNKIPEGWGVDAEGKVMRHPCDENCNN